MVCYVRHITATAMSVPSSPSSSIHPSDDDAASSVGSLTAAVDRVAFRADDTAANALAADIAQLMCDEKGRAAFVMLQRSDVVAVMEELHDLREKLADLAAPASGGEATKVYKVLRECQTVKDIDTKLAQTPGMSVLTTGENGQCTLDTAAALSLSRAVLTRCRCAAVTVVVAVLSLLLSLCCRCHCRCAVAVTVAVQTSVRSSTCSAPSVTRSRSALCALCRPSTLS